MKQKKVINFCEKNPAACTGSGSNRLIYDNCYYNQWLHDSVNPFVYQMYEGKYENCGKCRDQHFYHPYDLVDVESELRNQSRPISKCATWKYNGTHKDQGQCKTFSSPEPKMFPPSQIINKKGIPRRSMIKQYIYNRPTKANGLGVDAIASIPIKHNNQIEEFRYIRKKKEHFNGTTPYDSQNMNETPQPINRLQSSTARCNLTGFSTFDPSVPIVYPPELCPIVFNNIKRPSNPGFVIPKYIE